MSAQYRNCVKQKTNALSLNILADAAQSRSSAQNNISLI